MAQVTPEPTYNDGQVIKIAEDLPQSIEYVNLRILSSTHELPTDPKKTWLVPAEKEVPLPFFRKIFTNLKEQLKLEADEIPSEAFQRAFERLFFILGDTGGLQSEDVDENRDNLVGWGEFVYVFKRRRTDEDSKGIRFKLTIPERIFLTFDNPEASHLGQFVSVFVLVVIIVSSACFILSTVKAFQKDDPWLVKGTSTKKPEPADIFVTIEQVCLIIFVIEYIIRTATCWAHKPEVFDQPRMLEMVTGYEVLAPPQPWMNFIKFVLAPANLVDLVAILPGVIGIFKNLAGNGGEKEGGGFVVLRLVRLTRIFRAFKSPELRGPVTVIYKTLEESTKALYILGFNLLLGVLIAGSLMYVVEKGDWVPEERSYKRYVGTFWNATSAQWEDIKEESPFISIPYAMWWAVVTATTVGYGDMFPTTPLGYVIAGMTMMYSLVILALPVGIISSKFSEKWDEYEKDRIIEAEQASKDRKYITSEIQRIDPYALSNKFLVELWHERKVLNEKKENKEEIMAISEKKELSEGVKVASSPEFCEFMGEASILLDLGPNHVNKTEWYDLVSNSELSTREVTGAIRIGYEWTPKTDEDKNRPFVDDECTPKTDEDDLARRTKSTLSTHTTCNDYPALSGELKVILIEAKNLTNCCLLKTEKTPGNKTWERTSNPYAIVYCYDKSPEPDPKDPEKKILCPAIWRSTTKRGTLNPSWNDGTKFKYQWRSPEKEIPKEKAAKEEGSGKLSSELAAKEEGSGKSSPDLESSLLQEASTSCGPDQAQLKFSPLLEEPSGTDMKDKTDDPAKLMATLQQMVSTIATLQQEINGRGKRDVKDKKKKPFPKNPHAPDEPSSEDETEEV